jgi:hypothetical protein
MPSDSQSRQTKEDAARTSLQYALFQALHVQPCQTRTTVHDDHRAAPKGRHPTPTDQAQTPPGTSRQTIVAAQHPAALRGAGSTAKQSAGQQDFVKNSSGANEADETTA